MGSKGFFIAFFFNREDQERVFENGPYLYNSMILHLRYWTKNLLLKKEHLSYAPMWIKIYSLLHGYWDEEILEGIGNTLGTFVNDLQATEQGNTHPRLVSAFT